MYIYIHIYIYIYIFAYLRIYICTYLHVKNIHQNKYTYLHSKVLLICKSTSIQIYTNNLLNIITF